MITDTLIEDPRWRAADLPALAERAALSTLDHLGLDAGQFEIAVLACDDARIAALNTDFRDKPTPTNVLSWPSGERGSQSLGAPDGTPPAPPELPMDAELGDIAISYDTCLKEAAAAHKSLDHHATHLVVHGILHLLGYDHIRDQDATLMEQLEQQILGKLGIDDPYTID